MHQERYISEKVAAMWNYPRGVYVELSYTEFCRCRESDQTYMDKLFIPIQGCLLEVVREQYTDFYRDKERWRYLQKLDTKNRLLSLDGFTDSEGNPLDFITDEAVDIAETVVNAVMVDRLKAALPLLSDSEQELIQAIFFDGLSEREVGANKIMYHDKTQAQRAADQSLIERGAELWVYRCEYCGCWHLTHRDPQSSYRHVPLNQQLKPHSRKKGYKPRRK